MENLKLRNFSVGYKNNIVVRNINLSLYSGEWLGVIGPNGSGKSTLVKGIMGIIKSLKGNIYLKDEDIKLFKTWGF